MDTLDGKMLSDEQAVSLAHAFAGVKGKVLGPLVGVKHRLGDAGQEGSFEVEFEYRGPPPRRRTVPPRDHPTVVFVSDRTGTCKFMMWM